MLLGRKSARAIASTSIRLFRLVDSDRDAALAEVSKVKSFGSRRLLMESFRLTFSLMHEPSKYHILLEDNDLNYRVIARQYDQALLKLLRDCRNNKELLSAKLIQYPVKKRKIALERLEHPDFLRSRRIKLNNKIFYDLSNSRFERGPLAWWQWAIVVLFLSIFLLIFSN